MKSSGNRQHFVPQAYLKRFTSTGKKSGSLLVYDLIRDRAFSTTTINVAQINQYYRLTSDLYPSLEPDSIDQFLDVNVSILSEQIERTIEKRAVPCPEKPERDLFFQMGLLMARNPESILGMRTLYEVAIKEHALTAMHDAPKSLRDAVSSKGIYEALRIEFEEDYFRVNIGEAAIRYCVSLKRRNWCVVEVPKEYTLITSDVPVSVRKLGQVPSNGSVDDIDTQVYFPLSKRFGLVGSFAHLVPYEKLTAWKAAFFNTVVLERPMFQVFSAERDFICLDEFSQMRTFSEFLKWRRRPDVSEEIRNTHEAKLRAKRERTRKVFLENFDPKTLRRLGSSEEGED